MMDINLHELEKIMYAIIKTGGKQYRVATGDVIDVELLKAEIGSTVEFQEVLFTNDGAAPQIGQPNIAGLIVTGEVLGNTVGPKVTSLKYTASQHTQTKWGHRQHYTRVKILAIGGTSGKKAATKRKPKNEEQEEAA